MIHNTSKINALTSLRFFAALMIILLHTNGIIINFPYLGSFSFQKGVSIFFVLSGFILTYVYPELSNKKAVLHFLKARIARIWPAHFSALIISILLFGGYHGNELSFFLSTIMIHSWLYIETYALNFNQPAWSIGTEFFFYLCFPLLIYRFSQTWLIKFIFGVMLVIGAILVGKLLNLPDTAPFHIDILSLVYYGPICRLFEFIVGMVTALAYQKLAGKIAVSFVTASIFEISSIFLLFYSLQHNLFEKLSIFSNPSRPALLWETLSGGSFLWIALLIFIFAFQKGIISRLLQLSVFVMLGEISYSLYLLHVLFLNYYGIHTAWFKSHFNYIEIPILYWTLCLTSAYLLWRFIETPCRRLIRHITWPTFQGKPVLLEKVNT